MSINVTVTGNPVTIRRGKMVTADLNHTSKEFQQRRRMRIEQVRQQSKEVAESVRNKVRKERSKQLSNIEKEGAEKLDEWRNKKLLELQNQYRESLKEIGIGHTQAMVEEAAQTDFIVKRDKSNELMAKRRGALASQKEQITKNEKSLQSAIPKQSRRMARDIENARAANVSKVHKSPKKRRKKSISVSKNFIDSDSELEEIIDIASEVSDTETSESSGYRSPPRKIPPKPSSPKHSRPSSPVVNTESSSHTCSSSKVNEDLKEKKKMTIKTMRSSKVNEDLKEKKKTTDVYKGGRKRSLSPKASTIMTSIETPLDTRISDRINNRRILETGKGVPQKLSVIESSNLSPTNIKPDRGSNIYPKRQAVPRQEIVEADVHKECSGGPGNANPLYPCSTPVKMHSMNTGGNCGPFCNVHDPCSRANLCCCCKNREGGKSMHKCKCSGIEHPCTCNSGLVENVAPRTTKCKCSGIEHPCTCNSGLVENVAPRTCSWKSVGTGNPKFVEIPPKPTISVRSDIPQSTRKKEYTRVLHYDHSNRFSKDYIVDNSNVQRIPDDCIHICANIEESDTNLQRITLEREKKALMRGKIALQKEKIQKEYEGLLQKLPMLQKQERIASLDPAKDKFHMSEKRLKEHEGKRQQKIEAAYEKFIPKTITISPRNHPKPKDDDAPFQVVDTNNDANVGSWRNDRDVNKENLKTLLQNLKTQKEMLLQENEVLPTNSNLGKVISDLDKSGRNRTYNPTSSTSTYRSPKRKRKIRQNTKATSTNRSVSPMNKQRIHRDVLILQNTSTQTSPKILTPNSNEQAEQDKGKSVKETDVVDKNKSCLCNDGTDKICEIFIKIQENEKPEIIITSPRKPNEIDVEIKNTESKQHKQFKTCMKPQEVVATKHVESKSVKSSESKKTKKHRKANVQIVSSAENRRVSETKSSNRSSWKEQLSKNDTHSSTSYYSPPDYSSQNANLLDILQNKPQQSNVASNRRHRKTVDQNLLAYIQKLLLMSKPSIENLGVSSVSEVSTPSCSVIESQSNSGEAQKLINLLRTINFNVDNLGQFLTNTVTNNSTIRNPSQAHTSGYDASRSRTIGTTPMTVNETGRSNKNVSTSDDPHLIYSEDAAKTIAKVADKCQKKIIELAAKIQSLRSEPLPMYSPISCSPSDKENHTSYMNLPSLLIQQSMSSDNSYSPEQIELTRKLLEADLKKISRTLTQTDNEQRAEFVRRDNEGEVDNDIIDRYLKLLVSDDGVDKSISLEKERFVPVLSDIPKLPKFPSEVSTAEHKRPPIAKGLTAVRKYNNFNMNGHELSTIPEIDSMLKSPEVKSRRTSIGMEENQRQPKSPPPRPSSSSSGKVSSKDTLITSTNTSSQHSQSTSFSPQQDIELAVSIEPKAPSPQPSPSTSKTISTAHPQPPCICSPQPGTSKESLDGQKSFTPAEIANIVQKLQDISTDSSSGKSEDVETMLRNMGMGWAVATMRKTQEALAQQSSSSSPDNTKLQSSMSSKGKPTTSTMSKSDNSISPFLKDTFQNVSAILGSTAGVERHHRTSTPVQTTKSSDKSKSNSVKTDKTVESSVLSVLDKSEDVDMNFVSVPDQSSNDSSRSD